MPLTLSRLPVALVLPATVLVGHALAYLGAPTEGHDVDHRYLPLAAALAAPLAVAGMCRAALGTGRPGSSVGLGRVLGFQWLVFTGQELVEHLVAGHHAGALMESAPLWLGLVAQLVAGLTTALLLARLSVLGDRMAVAFGERWALSLFAPRAAGAPSPASPRPSPAPVGSRAPPFASSF